jgi:enamine deaminase RidA (YjgF/YER057c/UK114 family)
MSSKPHTSGHVLQPAGWSKPSGYSHGMIASGQHVILAGQVGWNPATAAFETDDFAAQVRQSLSNIVVLLGEAGGAPYHLVRLTWYITDLAAYVAARKEIGVAYRELIGMHFPPMSVVVVSALIENRAKVEIEATAVIPE